MRLKNKRFKQRLLSLLFISVALSTSGLSACGQKGPLVLSDDKPLVTEQVEENRSELNPTPDTAAEKTEFEGKQIEPQATEKSELESADEAQPSKLTQ